MIQFSSTCQPLGGAATEAYQYDDLQRLLGSSRSWTGTTPGTETTPGDSYAYDDLGNITSKSDYASLYTYGSSRITGAAGPHAVVSVSTGATFTYDQNGNLTQGDGRTVAFDSLDRPITVTLGGVTTEFRYAPDGVRYLQRTTGATVSPTAKTVYYVDKDYERIAWSSGAIEEKTYLGPSVVIERNGATRDVRYLHLDQLGSTDAVTNAGAFELTSDGHGFDAFGRPRGRDWSFSGDKLHPSGDYGDTTEHGFTGHEHLDDTYLIHMNGRVYDYRLGRFLSVDPIISNPANSQSINPYSYIGNNPLSGVDPTGYCADGMTTVTGSNICRPISDLDKPLPFNVSLGTNVMYGATRSNGSGNNTQTAALPDANPSTTKAPGSEAKSSDRDKRAPGPSSRPLVNDGLITLEYTTHIPGKRITDPLKSTFAGDGRDFDEPGTYRTRQSVVINTQAKEIFSTSDTGKTYRINSGTDQVTATGQADPNRGFETRGPTASGDSVLFFISGHAINPLATLSPIGGVEGPNYAPAIDYELKVALSKGTVTVSGWHDQFPAHELSVNGQSMYRFDPRTAGTSANVSVHA